MSSTSMTHDFRYVGSELALFEHATNWKAYWRDQIAPYIHGDVLEVGAGLGANTRLLAGLPYQSWTCLEPDTLLAKQITLPAATRHHIRIGTTADLSEAEFHTILYIDVLEHIEEDRAELARACRLLHPGGVLVVLSPAHPFLFTRFDAAIGHYRRYTRRSLRAVAPPGLRECQMRYLDAAGLLASAGNRLLLRQALPTLSQIHAWDRLLVPLSRRIDRLLGWRYGKTVVGVWRRDP